MKIGYARVSTQEQSVDVQLEQLAKIGCDKIYQEQQSGKSADDREELNKLRQSSCFLCHSIGNKISFVSTIRSKRRSNVKT
jgi:hypothetical protein